MNRYVKPEIIGKRIKFLMESNNMDSKQLAKEIGIHIRTLLKRFSGEKEFNIDEVVKIVEIFNLTGDEAENIFFNPNFEFNTLIEK